MCSFIPDVPTWWVGASRVNRHLFQIPHGYGLGVKHFSFVSARGLMDAAERRRARCAGSCPGAWPSTQLARPADLTPRHRFLERDAPTDPLRLDQQVRHAWASR